MTLAICPGWKSPKALAKERQKLACCARISSRNARQTSTSPKHGLGVSLNESGARQHGAYSGNDSIAYFELLKQWREADDMPILPSS